MYISKLEESVESKVKEGKEVTTTDTDVKTKEGFVSPFFHINFNYLLKGQGHEI